MGEVHPHGLQAVGGEHRGERADFDVVADTHTAQVHHAQRPVAHVALEAEARIADHCGRLDFAIAPDARTAADHGVGAYQRAFADHHAGLDHRALRHAHRGMYLRWRGRPLESGMVVSIETAIHHPRRGFIKLEDTVAVTDAGWEAFGDHGRGWNRGGTAR